MEDIRSESERSCYHLQRFFFREESRTRMSEKALTAIALTLPRMYAVPQAPSVVQRVDRMS
jgi:hypothetical protein